MSNLPSPHDGPSEHEGPRGVTRTKSASAGSQRPERPTWTIGEATAFVSDAGPLSLLERAGSPAAQALVAVLQAEIEAGEQRGNQRRAKGRDKLRTALEAIVGGVLTAWLRREELVFCVLTKSAFTGKAVSYAPIMAAFTGLEALGYVHRFRSSQRPISDGEGGEWGWSRLATRFGPEARLIDLALSYGITPETVRAAFPLDYTSARPTVTAPLVLKPFKARPGQKRMPLPAVEIDWSDPAVIRMADDVTLGNEVLSRHTFAGCVRPVLYRQVIGALGFHGRWYAAGVVSVTNMPRADRAAIQIDGAQVAELDVNASNLRILAAAAGTPDIAGDPYELPGFERDAVKAMVAIFLGVGGRPLRAIKPDTLRQHPALQRADLRALDAALVDRYPWLPDAAGILGVPRERVSLKLHWIEAEALTAALRVLWLADIVALPLHDALVVPLAAADVAAEAMRGAWLTETAAHIVLKVKRPDR